MSKYWQSPPDDTPIEPQWRGWGVVHLVLAIVAVLLHTGFYFIGKPSQQGFVIGTALAVMFFILFYIVFLMGYNINEDHDDQLWLHKIASMIWGVPILLYIELFVLIICK